MRFADCKCKVLIFILNFCCIIILCCCCSRSNHDDFDVEKDGVELEYKISDEDGASVKELEGYYQGHCLEIKEKDGRIIVKLSPEDCEYWADRYRKEAVDFEGKWLPFITESLDPFDLDPAERNYRFKIEKSYDEFNIYIDKDFPASLLNTVIHLASDYCRNIQVFTGMAGPNDWDATVNIYDSGSDELMISKSVKELDIKLLETIWKSKE